MRQYYGWDIGGAHLKLAVISAGVVSAVRQVACPLWQGIAQLRAGLQALRAEFEFDGAVHAVSMTGELCDIFASRAAGVTAILAVFEEVVAGKIVVYAGAQGWFNVAQSRQHSAAVASMNWHATAAFIARREAALVIDIGTTTTDLLPVNRTVAVRGRTDAERLQYGELIYTGVCRTPVMAVCKAVPVRGAWRAIAAEYFANMADVYRLTGELPVGVDLHPTADGRAADVPHSAARLARMVCEDFASAEQAALVACARFIREQQLAQIQQGIALLESANPGAISHATYIGAGAGEFLARRIAAINGARYRTFAAVAEVSEQCAWLATVCAPAVALAKLIAEADA